MKSVFPVLNQGSQTDKTQSRLLILATLFMITYALVLSLAPAVRYQAGSERYQINHWIGTIIWIVCFSTLHYATTRKLPNRDPFILPIVAFLSGLGLMSIWRLYPDFGMRQTVWLALSCILVFVGVKFPFFLDYLRRYKYIWLIMGLILTGLTIVLGSNPSGTGPKLWLQVFGLYFQPSEPLKLLLIAYLAGFFTDQPALLSKKYTSILPTALITTLALLLLIFQKDMGTASIFLLLYLAMLYTTQKNKLILWITPILVVIASLAGYFVIDIIRFRINTWLNPFIDPGGSSYQVIQSIIAIAEGGIFGAGPGLGSPGLIPVSVSDFIFSAIAEELGLFGIILVISLIILLLYRGLKLALSTQNTYYRHLSFGLIFYFGIQSIFIIGGNIGLFPLTGITLPFVSYGGTSLVVSFLAIVILLIISDNSQDVIEPMPTSQARFAIVGGLMVTLLVIEILVTSLFSFWFMPSLTSRPDNLRWTIDDRFTKRGDILDRNNQIIVTNLGVIGAYQRTNNHIPLNPVIGYTSATFGQTGIESSMFPYLRGYEGYPFITGLWQDLLRNQPPPGLDIRLTIDLILQQKADTLLGDNLGSVILMNAESGEILAMASHPYFDTANLDSEWDNLINDEDAPLINRATQGSYPPGAILLPFLFTQHLDLIQQNPETLISSANIHLSCMQRPGDDITWQALIGNGCLEIQGELAEKAGREVIQSLYQDLAFFSEPQLHLTVAEAINQTDLDDSALFWGKSEFQISPLQLALAASALTNNGVLPGPRIVNAYLDPQENWVTIPKLSANSTALSADAAQQTTTLLRKADSSHWQVIAKATTEDDKPITWFISGTTPEWQGQPFTIVVVIERDAPDLTARIGTSLLEEALRFSVFSPDTKSGEGLTLSNDLD